MDFDIVPYRSCGLISFQNSRALVKEKLADLDCLDFKRNEFQTGNADVFDNSIFVYYDSGDQCSAVEIGNGRHSVLFQGWDIFQSTYSGFKEWLSRFDEHLVEDDEGFSSRKFGISVYAPDKNNDPACAMEAVTAFSEEYYDN
jgi:hypothetical protein